MGQSDMATKAEPQIYPQVSFRGSTALTGILLLLPILMFMHPCRQFHLGLLVQYPVVLKRVEHLESMFVCHS